MCILNCVHLFLTPWTVALQAPLSMEFSRQEYWSGLPFLIPEDPPDPGSEPASLASPALAGGLFTTAPPGKPQHIHTMCIKWVNTILLSTGDETQYLIINYNGKESEKATQGSNPGLPHCRWILYQLSHKGSPQKCVYIYLYNWITLLYTWN